jgi:ABC-type multidrug transport system fused ATPase/permease subunit
VPLAALDLAAWRRSIGYLGQDPVLFAGSVRDNVRWGREGGDDAAVEAALHAADAGFVFALPGGLDADLGELGRRLSGGERQRLALARAFYGRPRLLILDEATGALDMETERNIVAAVAARRGKVTVLAITHRIAPARACDRIVMLEAGRIVEQGSFSELAVANGRFARFFRPAEETAGADDRLPAAT